MHEWVLGALGIVGTAFAAWLTYRNKMTEVMKGHQMRIAELQETSEERLWVRVQGELDRLANRVDELEEENKNLKGEVAKLRVENDTLRAAHQEMRNVNERLGQQVAELTAANSHLDRELVNVRTENALLRERMRKVETTNTGPLNKENKQ